MNLRAFSPGNWVADLGYRERVGGLVVLAIAVAARVTAILIWGSVYDLGSTFDDVEYVVLGQNLRLHGVFSYGTPGMLHWGDRVLLDAPGPYLPVATRAPMLPFLIAALWWQQAPPVLELQIVQCILGTATVLLVYLFCLSRFGFASAMISALMVALGPVTVFVTHTALTETLFTFLLTCFVLCWAAGRGVPAGLFLGVAILTRAVCLPLVGLLLLMAVALKFRRSLHLRIALIAVAVVAPWTLRNALTEHAFIPVSSMGWGANLLLGTIDVPYAGEHPFKAYDSDTDFWGTRRTAATVREAEQKMERFALERIREAPLKWLKVRFKQYLRLWTSSGGFLSMAPGFNYLYVALSLCFWGAAVVGMVLARHRWRELYPVVIVPVALAFIHFVGAAEERYSVPLVPMAAAFAGYAIIVVVDWARRAGRARPAET